MAAMPRINVKSQYLTDVENEAVFGAVGRRRVTLATTVGELYYSADEKKETWDRQYSGVVCFVKDNPKRAYFIRFFDRKKMQLVWEQEVRTAPSDVFSGVFSRSDSCSSLTINDRRIIFLERDEAEHFQKEIDDMISKRRPRRKESTNTIDVGSAPSGGDAETHVRQSNKRKGKVAKDEIGKPTDFQHLNRVYWDPETGLNMEELDPGVRALLEKIGIKDKEQKQIDKETLDFIYDFIDNHGGVEAVANDVLRRKDESETKHREQKLPRAIGDQRARPPQPPSHVRNQKLLPPSPPNRTTPLQSYSQCVPPSPPGKTKARPPPPPKMNQKLLPPPPPSRNQDVPTQTPSDGTKKPSLQTSQDIGGAAAYQDNPLKQQIMQLLLQNPAQITDFIYGIVDKRGGIDFIKSNLTEPNTQTDSFNEVDDDSNAGVTDNLVSDRTSNSIQASGTMSSADEVAGRRSAGSVPGATGRVSRDFELSSDIFDGDDGEWDDVTDQD